MTAAAPVLSDDARYTLLLAARVDGQLSGVERALANQECDRLADSDACKVPRDVSLVGALSGPFLTDAGRRRVRAVLPRVSPEAFPALLADQLRRIRDKYLSCSEVTGEWTEYEGRRAYRVRWDGHGWASYSRQSPNAEFARSNRDELEALAVAVGWETVPEAAPGILLASPAPPEVFDEVPFEDDVADDDDSDEADEDEDPDDSDEDSVGGGERVVFDLTCLDKIVAEMDQIDAEIARLRRRRVVLGVLKLRTPLAYQEAGASEVVELTTQLATLHNRLESVTRRVVSSRKDA